MAREVLTAPLTLYVRNSALYTDAPGRIDTVHGACKTWQQAITIAESYDANGQSMTIQHGAEAGPVTFTAPLVFHERVGGGQLRIRGQTTPGNTVFNVTGADVFYLENTVAPVQFSNLTAQGGQTGIWMIVHNSRAVIESGVIVGTATYNMFQVHDKAALLYILSATPVTIAGNAAYCIFINMGQAFVEHTAFTISGARTFAGGFVQVMNTGSLQTVGCAFTGGTVTGTRYYCSLNGTIIVMGGGAGFPAGDINYFPGSIAGGVASGGQYA